MTATSSIGIANWLLRCWKMRHHRGTACCMSPRSRACLHPPGSLLRVSFVQVERTSQLPCQPEAWQISRSSDRQQPADRPTAGIQHPYSSRVCKRTTSFRFESCRRSACRRPADMLSFASQSSQYAQVECML